MRRDWYWGRVYAMLNDCALSQLLMRKWMDKVQYLCCESSTTVKCVLWALLWKFDMPQRCQLKSAWEIFDEWRGSQWADVLIRCSCQQTTGLECLPELENFQPAEWLSGFSPAWALCSFIEPFSPISLFGHSNFFPRFSAYVSVFSIVWPVGNPHMLTCHWDTMLLIVQGHRISSILNKTTFIWITFHEGCIWICLCEVLWKARIKKQSILQFHSCVTSSCCYFIFGWCLFLFLN